MTTAPDCPRLISSSKPPRRATACATFCVSASFRKLKASKSVDLPDPLAPTTIAIGGNDIRSAWQNRR